MGHEFPFPIDVRLDSNPVVGASAPGQASLEYMEAAFPLLQKQQEVLKALVDDRREHHRELQNRTKQGGTLFVVRDMVITRVEVQGSWTLPSSRTVVTQHLLDPEATYNSGYKRHRHIATRTHVYWTDHSLPPVSSTPSATILL